MVQLHPITLPPMDGPAALQIGLYASQDGQRLRRDGGPPDDMVVLAQDIR
ncbi:MAG: hypothetical protein IPG51_19125 [Chloroflexi bacterium]|nr:hypothetical protein [Chloroflexota bacterium]